jgi:putative two-component system response regulator
VTSPLHDIGKIGVPDSILLKKGRFNLKERTVMKGHCQMGASILLEGPKGMSSFLDWKSRDGSPPAHTGINPFLLMASNIAMTHHERWDGAGYPQRLSGEAIPLEARIVAVADVYDALRSRRPYKPPFSEKESRKTVRDESGAHFDPAVVRVFEGVELEFREIESELSDRSESFGQGESG